ncbi:FtsW/RodA/SpoVE family cell cycle protein [Lachnospiraceae bacterium WCA-9-b2]|jgi:cell division protein FtsW (lipid II flippase)|uniref:FtsW/RodA/SpoVE family cell cycle protein n=1 Tax=Sporofaciens musculi TaxID=2681861 RepID=A0A7X3SKA4_9FIRM|nr:FtsW/RodA/SpoVE family cell cycle protein [Sporofaciens musculi]MCI9422938.1 FtsW/RodA/SpoVE family cell cycle protein [Dorea sp.]MXP77368.1 FtsW/RodA/SpoVE family cell cycle protein [Sporofaciens musculi]
MKKEEYLRILAEQIRCKQARAQVTQEIRSHIEEQEEFYISEGLNKEEAQAEAVRQMGDPVEAGAALDLVHRPRMAWGWIALIGGLYGAGYILLNLLQSNFSKGNFIAGDHVKWMLIGFAVLIGVCYLDYSRIGRWAREITVAAFIVVFVGMFIFGQQINGALGWITLPILSLSLNIRLCIFLFVPLYAAIVYRYHGQGYLAVGKSLLWMLPGLCIALRVTSVLTVLMLFLIYLLILSFAVVKEWFKVSRAKTLLSLWGGTVLLSGIGYLKLFLFGPEYQRMRVANMLQLESGGESYQLRLLKGILEGCRWIGSGEGKMVVKSADRIMEGMDYGLMYITACYGILVSVLVIGMLTALFICFMGMSVGQRNRLGSIIGFGCTAAFLVQLLFYVMMNTGILPSSSVYCPFLTYGGTGVLVTNTLIGLLLSIYRYQDVLLESETESICVY